MVFRRTTAILLMDFSLMKALFYPQILLVKEWWRWRGDFWLHITSLDFWLCDRFYNFQRFYPFLISLFLHAFIFNLIFNWSFFCMPLFEKKQYIREFYTSSRCMNFPVRGLLTSVIWGHVLMSGNICLCVLNRGQKRNIWKHLLTRCLCGWWMGVWIVSHEFDKWRFRWVSRPAIIIESQ